VQSAIYAFENPSFKIEAIEKETPGNIPKITDKTALTTLLFLRLQERDLETIHNLHNAITFGDHSEAVWIGARFNFTRLRIYPPAKKSKVRHLMTACLASFSRDRGLITAIPGQA
jgi:hypothetical protein